MDEKSVCANIEKLAKQLNEELKAATELGLNVRLHAISQYSKNLVQQISVRVWRETEMVHIGSVASDYKTWPIEAQVQLRDYLKKTLNDPPDKQ